MKIIKYKGNDEYIVALTKNDNKKYIFFAYIKSISLNCKEDSCEVADCFNRTISKFTSYKNYTLDFLLKAGKNNIICQLIEIEDEKEYDTIVKFLEFIL